MAKNIINAKGLAQVSNNYQAGPQSSINPPNINSNSINQQNSINQNQSKPSLPQETINNQPLIQ
jgi:hypothetical protein